MMAATLVKEDFDTVKGEILGEKPAEDTPEIAAYNVAERMIHPTIVKSFNQPAGETASAAARAEFVFEVGKAWALMEVIRDTLQAIKDGQETPASPQNRGYESNLLFWTTISPQLQNPDYVLDVIGRYETKYAEQIKAALIPK